MKISEIRESIIHDIAFIEAALDDPEHYDVDEYNDTLKINVIDTEFIDSKVRIIFSSVDGSLSTHLDFKLVSMF